MLYYPTIYRKKIKFHERIAIVHDSLMLAVGDDHSPTKSWILAGYMYSINNPRELYPDKMAYRNIS